MCVCNHLISVVGLDTVLPSPFSSLQIMATQLPAAIPQLTAVEDALKIFEDQLNCGICLDTYKDPKLLNCFHVFCTQCLQPLVRQTAQKQTLQCPNCRLVTTLPQNGVPGLQKAFHIHHLFDICDTLKKVNKTNCDKCKKFEATSYCRTCGFVCEVCKRIHQLWEELTSHDVISLDKLTGDVTKMIPPQKKILTCSKHKGKELELFCETCGDLICHNCTTKIHKGHSYDVISDTFEKHKTVMKASMVPIKRHLHNVQDSLKIVLSRRKEITTNQAMVEGEITAFMEKLIVAVDAKKTVLIAELARITGEKLSILTVQEEEIRMVVRRLSGCLEVVERSLHTGTQGEVLVTGKAIVKKISGLMADFKHDKLVPRERADIQFVPALTSLEACQKFGHLLAESLCPEKCNLQLVQEPSFIQKEAKCMLTTFKRDGTEYDSKQELIKCELVSSDGTTAASGTVKKTGRGQYELYYKVPRAGHYQLQVKVEGQHIQGSPFSVTAVKDLTTPISIIHGLTRPCGVAITKDGHFAVSEYGMDRISIFNDIGHKMMSIGKRGSGPGKLVEPQGVAFDGDGNILVADTDNHRIQKFSPQGNHLTALGKKGTNALEFTSPSGVSVHPVNNRIYITESSDNHRVQVLDAHLNHIAMFGSKGSNSGKFKSPLDIAFDTTGHCYVADGENGRVQVFTEDGQYLRQFGKKGEEKGEIGFCSSIAIASDIVYIADEAKLCISLFTCDGSFITSFGTCGSGPGQFNYPRGIAVDKSNGLVYVSDYWNNRIQIF